MGIENNNVKNREKTTIRLIKYVTNLRVSGKSSITRSGGTKWGRDLLDIIHPTC